MHAEPKNEVILELFMTKLDMLSTSASNDGKKKTMKYPIPKKKLKSNRGICIIFGVMSRRQNVDITRTIFMYSSCFVCAKMFAVGKFYT